MQVAKIREHNHRMSISVAKQQNRKPSVKIGKVTSCASNFYRVGSVKNGILTIHHLEEVLILLGNLHSHHLEKV